MNAPNQQTSSGGSFLLWLFTFLGLGVGAAYLIAKTEKGQQARHWTEREFGDTPWWVLAPLAPLAPIVAPIAAPFLVHEAFHAGVTGVLRQVQAKLGVPVTGENDAATHAAVLAFQRSHGLAADGVIGPQTLGALVITPHQTLLPLKSIKLSTEEAAHALANAYQRVTGTRPRADVLGLMMAHTSFETRGGGSGWNLPNYNFGGVKASPMDPYAQIFPSAEGHGPAFPQRFAAWLTPEDGAEGWVRVMKARSNWWNGLHSGTAEGLVRGLTTSPAYFTGDPTTYLAGVKGLAASYAHVAQGVA